MISGVGNYRTGVALVMLSAATYSTAGLFAKGIASDAYTIIFWRGLFSAAFLSAWLLWRDRGRVGAEFAAMGGPGWAAALASSAGTAAFIPAFKFTAIANVALIYAAAPFAAAGVAWIWMREAPGRRTILASLTALAGVTVIVGGSLASPSLLGDLLALWMTLSMAVVIAIYRRYPAAPSSAPMIASSLLLAAVALFVTAPLDAPVGEMPAMAGFGLVHALAYVTLVEGARRLPAVETGLLSALETPLAPVWAWLLLSEIPNTETILGGSIILAAVFWRR